MRRSDVLALAARVEALTGPDRAVDAEVAHVVGLAPRGVFRVNRLASDPGTFATGANTYWTASAYTASLDAAASLVPAGWAWCVHDIGVASAMSAPRVVKTSAATPALALTAAALRAIAEGMSDA